MLYMEISESRKKISFELKIIRYNLKVAKNRKSTKSQSVVKTVEKVVKSVHS